MQLGGPIYVSSYEIHKHVFLIIVSKMKGGLNFQASFCIWFIVDLLIQYEFCCVDRICRRWSTRKMNQITLTYLITYACASHLSNVKAMKWYVALRLT